VACYNRNATIEDSDDRIFAQGYVEIRNRSGLIFETFPKLLSGLSPTRSKGGSHIGKMLNSGVSYMLGT
jgi:hypothetical protein